MTPYYADDHVTLYHGDCREVAAHVGPVEVVVTDPPFNVGKDYGTTRDDMDPAEYEAMLAAVAGACERQAWVTPTNRLSMFSRVLGDAALPVVVVRGAQGPKRWGWFDQFDIVLVRGKPSRYVSNLWSDIRLKGEGYFFREDDFGHPGYTPMPLMARLVGLLSTSGPVLDPFAGTGTTLIAAKRAGIRSIGVEVDERYCEVAANRLRQEVLGLVA